MTETCSHIAVAVQAEKDGIRGEGPPLLFAEITIRNGSQEVLAALQRGEIWVKGPQISVEETNSDGWLRTGDLGYLDRQGNLVVLEREEDVYNIGGETVYSAETIAIVEQFPGIQDCWVFGLPDREWGWRLIALVVPLPNSFFTVDDLILHCRKSLSALQCPREFLFVGSIPRSSTGKVLREQAIESSQEPLGMNKTTRIAHRASSGIEYHGIESGTGHSLLFLHGFTGHSAAYSNFLRHMMEYFRIISLDLPGHGNTTLPTSLKANFLQIADDIAEIIRTRVQSTTHCVGYSWEED